MSTPIWLAAHGRGFLPADERAEKFRNRFEPGEVLPFRPVRVRDITAHRRYWKLMDLCAQNCERIEIAPGAWMEVKTKEDVHTAIKLCTGHYTEIFDAENTPIARVPKTTNFEEMTAEEWEEYWPRVLDAVQTRIIPGIRLSDVVLQLHKCMGWASSNA